MVRWADVEEMVLSIPGYLIEGQERWLFETARAIPDGLAILEVGAYLGRATAALAFACVGTAKRVWAIDTFCGNETDFVAGRDFTGGSFLSEWRGHMDRCGLSDYVTPLVGPSSQFYATWDRPTGFVFIDGSHQYRDVLADLCYFTRAVVPCGVVALHDVNPECPWPGPYRAWCEMGATLLENRWHFGTIAYGQRPPEEEPC